MSSPARSSATPPAASSRPTCRALGRLRPDAVQQQGQAGQAVRALLQQHASLRAGGRPGRDGVSPMLFYDPVRARRRHAAPEPHLREGRVRSLAADDVRRQRHRRPARDARPATRGQTRTSPATSRGTSRPSPRLGDLVRRSEAAGARRGRGGRRATGRRACGHADHRPSRRARPPLPDGRAQPRTSAPARPSTENDVATRVELDIEGNQRAVRDARGRRGGRAPAARRHALRLRHARQPHPPGQHGGGRALDAERRGRQADPRLGQPRPPLASTYDALRRPTGPLRDRSSAGTERLGSDARSTARARATRRNHLRPASFQAFDARGTSSTSDAYDFKGNLREHRRDLVPSRPSRRTGCRIPLRHDGSFTEQHDLRRAQPRRSQSTTPDSSVYRPTFNEANCSTGRRAAARGRRRHALRHQHRLRRQGPAHADRLRQRRQDRPTSTTR